MTFSESPLRIFASVEIEQSLTYIVNMIVRDLRKGMTCMFRDIECKIIAFSNTLMKRPKRIIDMVAIDSGKFYCDTLPYDLKLELDEKNRPVIG